MAQLSLSIIIIERSTSALLQTIEESIVRFLDSLAVKYQIHFLSRNNSAELGYGNCIKTILRTSGSDYVITIDSDLHDYIQVIKDLWENKDRAEIVIASRYIQGASSSVSFVRRGLSRTLNFICSAILSLKIKDLSSANRLYRKCAFEKFNYESSDYDFLLESLIRAVCAGYSVIEVPLVYTPSSPLKRYSNFLKFTFRYLFELRRMWALRNSVDSADYDNRAYDSRIPLQRYWQRQRFKIITDFISGIEGRVLDVGCGSSRIVQSLPDMVAVDIARHKLRFLRSANKHLIQASTFHLPFMDKSFEALIHSEVIEHIAAGPEVFQEMNRVLKRGSILVVGTPDYGRIWWPIFEFFYDLILPNAYAQEHITHYTKESLLEMLRINGFDPIEYRYILGGELIIKAIKL